MLFSIILFGALALPFAALTAKTYSVLIATSVLYCFLTAISSAYQTMESSYIPLFMRSPGLFGSGSRSRLNNATLPQKDPLQKRSLIRGARISVLGLVVSNIGGLTALLIGVVISYTRGVATVSGYQKYVSV